ncbi:hypothetical protein IA539_14690 [Gordonia sp. zg691]|uniref:hypothetical protein n=1 Tax=Gordonia jinghuaiqii TaxID=2758710 RepID=UPI0016622897|nr:hypothetical protein [Gordonia jinghuaiqii]MBD0862451.1 hypothetical protein [Gordonia jinghuaiqii]
MSAIEQRHLLKVLQGEIEKIPEEERAPRYAKHLKERLIAVLALEREHRTRATNIKAKVLEQVQDLAESLETSSWKPEGD